MSAKELTAILLALAFVGMASAKPVYGPYHVLGDAPVRVIDGDTVVLDLATDPDHFWKVHVRVAGVDTPEIEHRKSYPPCQIPMGLKAKAYTTAWFDGATDLRVTRVTTGSFLHRAVGHITALKDGARHDLGADLLAAGLARPFVEGRTGVGWCQ